MDKFKYAIKIAQYAAYKNTCNGEPFVGTKVITEAKFYDLKSAQAGFKAFVKETKNGVFYSYIEDEGPWHIIYSTATMKGVAFITKL